jgi:hypothetical protein
MDKIPIYGDFQLNKIALIKAKSEWYKKSVMFVAVGL